MAYIPLRCKHRSLYWESLSRMNEKGRNGKGRVVLMHVYPFVARRSKQHDKQRHTDITRPQWQTYILIDENIGMVRAESMGKVKMWGGGGCPHVPLCNPLDAAWQTDRDTDITTPQHVCICCSNESPDAHARTHRNPHHCSRRRYVEHRREIQTQHDDDASVWKHYGHKH